MAREDQEPEGRDWGEVLVKIAAALGFNETRMRWKMQIWRQKLTRKGRQAEQSTRHLKYEHKICPGCGQLNDQGEQACTSCGQDLAGKRVEKLHRVGSVLPGGLSVSAVLGVILVLVYARLIAAEWPDAGILSLKVETLVRHGGHWTPAVRAGQQWRWLTCIFLHAGLWHIGFNLFALSQIGPAIEQVFGRGRLLVLFLFTGLCGSLVSYMWGMHGVGIGASGGVMGLCGVAAGWGHREGTTVGREIRAMMLKWAAYTILFGLFINADNAAHVGGFVSGGIIGFALQPFLGRTRRKGVAVTEVVLGGGGVLLGAALCLFPPTSPGTGSLMDTMGTRNPYLHLVTSCRLWDEGLRDQAMERINTGDHEDLNEESVGALCQRVAARIAQCRKGEGVTDAAENTESRQVCKWMLEAADSSGGT